MNKRTDLALESISSKPVSKEIIQKKRGKAFKITEIEIKNDNYLKSIGKGKGIYITLEGNNLSKFSDDYDDMIAEFSEELEKLIPEGDILIAGIGNNDITPDALGPQTANKILATRHLQNEFTSDEEKFLTSLRRVSVFAGGVLGQTGIETAEILKAICNEIKPSGIIVIDALACSDISRLGTTIQISNSGISPGSGVANSRKEISQKVFGIPVIAIGVPTVVDMYTIVSSMTDCEPDKNIPNMIVTPRDIDRLTERASQLISYGINLALQPSLSLDDVKGLF
ncbi:MAG: GPR endopeptidase [Oscillospiraceae bacterium]|nr:GPR endopeptidase [Oscillospiraceae bacterium]